MDDFHFCGLPESMASESLRRNSQARWFLSGSLSRIDRDRLRAVIANAFTTWGQTANVKGVEAEGEAQADLLVRIASIDGRSGVLADCQLPGPRTQLMRLDDAESWVLHIGADVPASSIDIYRVVLHELGHFWGMGHAPAGSENLMAPIYSRQIWTPRQWETQWMQSTYGPPVTNEPSAEVPAEIWIKGSQGNWLAGYKLAGRIL